jgi:hypothetical protein
MIIPINTNLFKQMSVGDILSHVNIRSKRQQNQPVIGHASQQKPMPASGSK